MIFEGIMTAEGYSICISQWSSVHAGQLPKAHLKVSSKVEEGVNWWKTPAESPDSSPIEVLWHEMKEYVRREVKPSCKDI